MKTPTAPTDPKDVKGIREFLSNVRDQMCSMADYLSEPFKGQFIAMKEAYNAAIAKLPPTDMVPAAEQGNEVLNSVFYCMMNLSQMQTLLNTAMNSMVQNRDAAVATALNSAVGVEITNRIAAGTLFAKEAVEVKVTEAIAARTTAGELVPKLVVTQLCSQAKTEAFAEGERNVREEMAATETRKTTIATRKASLLSANLPVPDATLESVLGGTEAEFQAVQAKAQQRIGDLQKKGVALNAKSPLSAWVWAPDDRWKMIEDLAVETLRSGNPLVAAPAGGGSGEAPKVMVC